MGINLAARIIIEHIILALLSNIVMFIISLYDLLNPSSCG